jgi:hypothetical protein
MKLLAEDVPACDLLAGQGCQKMQLINEAGVPGK